MADMQSFGKVGKFEKTRTYKYEGRDVYSWEQSMQEVLIYIIPPEGVTADMIDCKITVQRMIIGIRGNPPFLDVSRHRHLSFALRSVLSSRSISFTVL